MFTVLRREKLVFSKGCKAFVILTCQVYKVVKTCSGTISDIPEVVYLRVSFHRFSHEKKISYAQLYKTTQILKTDIKRSKKGVVVFIRNCFWLTALETNSIKLAGGSNICSISIVTHMSFY